MYVHVHLFPHSSGCASAGAPGRGGKRKVPVSGPFDVELQNLHHLKTIKGTP